MKILVLQLTRLGDILCTIPTLSALRREHPEAEVHFLVRTRFKPAADLVRFYDHLWQLDGQKLLGDFIVGSKDIPQALTRLTDFLNEMRSEKFDQIINLSFSPSSSFIAHLISGGNIPVLGYSRTSDFYLHVPDQVSQYFRAHGGLEKSNRVHIMDLLAKTAGLNLRDNDLHPFAADGEKSGIYCHIGASREAKSWPIDSWVAFLNSLVARTDEKIFLIGSNEIEVSEKIQSQVASNKVSNLVGQTNLKMLVSALSRAKLFIGADSGPLHVANLAGCISINLSLGDVRFWETGPTVRNSRVIVSRVPEHLMSDRVLTQALELLADSRIQSDTILCSGQSGVRYVEKPSRTIDGWPTIEWMYFGGPQPKFAGDLPEALKKIKEVASIAIQQIDALYKYPERVQIIGILDRLDDVLMIIKQSMIPLAPLIDEFHTQKENILPGSREEVFYQTRRCYENLEARSNSLMANALEGDGYEHSQDDGNLMDPRGPTP